MAAYLTMFRYAFSYFYEKLNDSTQVWLCVCKGVIHFLYNPDTVWSLFLRKHEGCIIVFRLLK